MNEVALSLATIAASLAMLVGVLYIVAHGARLHPEVRRKIVHVSLGLYCLSFPLIFSHAWEVALTCALAIGVFALARGALRGTLGAGLHSVSRCSYGEVYFSISVAALFALYDLAAPHMLGAAFYVLPLAILTVSDAAAAIVGQRFGRRRFRIWGASKSWEGVAAFAVTAWLLSCLCLTLLTDLGTAEIGRLALAVTAASAAIEAMSSRGLDNLFIPLGAYLVLTNVASGGAIDLTLAFAIAATALLALACLATPRVAP